MEHLSELQDLIARHTPGEAAPRMVGALNVGIARFVAPTPPVHHVYEPVVAVIAQGAKRIVVADRVFHAHAGQYSVVPLDLPLTFSVTQASEDAPYLAVALMLKAELIASLLLEAGAGERGSDEMPVIGISQAPPELLEPLVRLLRLLDNPSDIPILRPMIEREIVWRLLSGDQGALVRQIGLADSRLAKISHAIRWIREHYAEPFRIEDLAEQVAMSPTSFHRHFRAVTALSPLQYQKQIRLQEARSRLLAKAEDVAGIGFSVGYESPSQFSREYARLFGAPPGRDAAGFRAAGTS
jgi:AraC-like DNA-binding protein